MKKDEIKGQYIVRRRNKCIIINNENELEWRKLKDVYEGKATAYVVDIETAKQMANDFGGEIVKISAPVLMGGETI